MAKHDKRIKYHSEADKPVMLSLRVPRELNERLERYASLYRQKVSELVRDAIEMRLEVDADPRSRTDVSGTVTDTTVTDTSQIRHMLRQEFEAFLDARMPLIQAIARQTPPDGNGLYGDESYSVIHSHTDVESVETQAPAFDLEKYYLGKLCPGGHDWNGTGQTLKEHKGNKCRLCENAGKAARRQAKRQAAHAPAD